MKILSYMSLWTRKSALEFESYPDPESESEPDSSWQRSALSECLYIFLVCVYRNLFPSARFLFMYRDVVTVAKSLYRISATLPSMRLLMLLGSLSGHVSKIIADSMDCDGSDFCVRLDNGLMYGVIVFALAASSYLDQRRRGLDVSALRYEDLVARPLDMCRVILEFCHLPVSLAEEAVKAFDRDSQRNSLVAKSMVGNVKEPQLTPRTKLNELLKKHGVPLIGEPGVIEGTLSCH